MTEISSRRRWATLTILCAASLLLAIDLTVLHLAIPKLVADLAPTGNQILWIADIYGFTLGGLLVLMGNLGDRIGRKRLLLIGSVAFGLASVVTAYASSPELLIAARALLGVAGATIMPSTLSIIRNVFTDARERTSAVGIWGGVTAGGFAIGPIVGGVLLEFFWWGSVFLINVPVVVAIVVAGIAVIPESRNPRPGRLDVLSALLSIIGIVSVIYAIKEGFHGGFGQTDVLTAVALGALTLLVFGIRQTRLADPLIDLRLFRNRAFSASIAATTVSMFANLALSLILSQYLQLVLGWSPVKAGLAGLPGGMAGMVGGFLAGTLVHRIGRAAVVSGGLGLSAVGFALYTLIGRDTGYATLLPAMIIFGLGIGVSFATVSDTVLASVPRERAGAASAISETATEIGGAVGMGVLGSVLNRTYREHLDMPAGVPAEAQPAIRESLGTALHAAGELPGQLAGAVAQAARWAFIDGLHVMVISCAILVGVLAVAALFALRGVPAVLDTEEAPAEPVPTR
ncbi:DHA2 family efflux MFS transporter permease subunit [Actinoplanes sp. NPDC024001]|uniref:DHA2 family efflux MFS transporter permease subunit n=1 Tax=Actinoplanes sp. NPDC024001 TaxID=3154598 RepID=UPI0033CFB584